MDLVKVFREDLGTASFKSIKPLVDGIQIKLSRTENIKNNLSDTVLQQFYGPVSNIIALLNSIAKQDEAQFVSQKQGVQNSINTYNEQILNIWPQIAAIINDTDKNIEIDKTLEEIQRLKEKTLEDSNNIQEIKNSLTNDLKSFEERYKNEIFSKAEILKQEEAFAVDAKEFKRIADLWFWGILSSAFLLLICLFVVFKSFCFELVCFDCVSKINYDSICEGCNKSILYLEIFKAIAFRVLLISFFTYLLSLCVRNYNTNMHNYTVNKHKANSLSAALILLDKAKTNEGNDEIMTQAASSIFSHQPTGFNKKDPDNINSKIADKISDKFR